MSNAYRNAAKQINKTPQSQPIAGSNQVKNSAGGYSYEVDCWSKLNRFLVMGTEGGSFYASQQKLTGDNLTSLNECIAQDPKRTVQIIAETSASGKAARNTPAIFALAVAASSGDPVASKEASSAISTVCRTGTHMYEFAQFIKDIGSRGWGRGLRNGVGSYYTDSDINKLALHAVKYRQRNGWTHRDLMRLSHPKTDDPTRNLLFAYMVGKADSKALSRNPDLSIVSAYEQVAKITDPKKAIKILSENKSLPWEAFSNEVQKSPAFWEAIAPDMGMIALVRNLSRFARLNMLTPMGSTEKLIKARLTDLQDVKRSRIHPINALSAARVYGSGGMAVTYGSSFNPYKVNANIVEALEETFELAFDNVNPSGANMYIALDVSASMNASCMGLEYLSCRDGSAAMAMITAKTEPNTYVKGFTSSGEGWSRRSEAELTDLNIGKRSTLNSSISAVSRLTFGGTDCALPMIDAERNGIKADCFVVYTDSETWAGKIHPTQALASYRKAMNMPEAKLAVVGMASNNFSIADPDDPNMMDFVGFGSDTPSMISAFAGGELS